MNLNSITPGPLVSPEQRYETDLGTFTRFELYNTLAPTIQQCLTWGASQYTMYSGAELIMRAVIAMLNPDAVKQSADYFSEKLRIGLNVIGYDLSPIDDVERPKSVLSELYLGLNTKFPDYEKHYKDFTTGEYIGHQGLLRYIDFITASIKNSEDYQYDRCVHYLLKAVKFLIERNPESHLVEIEQNLLNAAENLGYRLEMVSWYKEMFSSEE